MPAGYRLTPEALLFADGTKVEFNPLPPDDQFAEIFRSSCRQPPTGEELVFLSIPPGAVVDGRTIRTRVIRTGAVFEAPLVDGGLDPMAIFALAGDTLEVTVIRSTGPLVSFRAAVPPRKPPVIVRTEPKKNRRDVPLNASIQVVFTEPVTAGSLQPQNISMRAAGLPMPGKALFANPEHTVVTFVPDQPLRNGVDYDLFVGTGVLDRDGNALEAVTVVPFTTESTGGEPPGAGPFVLSDTVSGSAWVSMPSRTWPIGAGALTVTIAVRRSGVNITKSMLMEGLDPVAFTARTGDSVIASVRGFGGLLGQHVLLVPPARPPAVIRVSPEPGDSFAPVSQPISVVFSEPLATASLSQGAITLLRAGEPMAVELRFADSHHTVVEVVPVQPVAAATTYELLIGTGIRDTGGQPLTAPVRSGFRTAATLPGGNQLAFVRDGQIFLVESDGTGLVQLTNTGSGIVNGGPSWSPDGQRLAFTRSDGEGGYDIYIMNADGGNVSRRTFEGYNFEPAWSPDGARIAFTRVEDGSAGIFVIDASGPSVVQPVLNRPGYDGAPAWSPDGSRISFTSDWRAYDLVYDLYVVSPDGSNVQSLLESPFFVSPATYYLSSAWSPDGSRIAVTACFNWSYWTCYPESGVALVNPDGSDFRVIARTTSGSYGYPTWSPDGQTIAFGASECPTEGCRTSLRWMRADGTSGGLILSNGTSPAWRPTP